MDYFSRMQYVILLDTRAICIITIIINYVCSNALATYKSNALYAYIQFSGYNRIS